MRRRLAPHYYVQVPVPLPARAITERNPMDHPCDSEGGPSSAAGASDKYLPSTPARSKPTPTPAAPGGPSVATETNGSDDDNDSGPKTSYNTTGRSIVPVAQQADMTWSSRVPSVPKAEMTLSSRVPRVPEAQMTEFSRVPRVLKAKMTQSS